MPLDSTLPPSVWRVSQPIPSFLSELSIPLLRMPCDPRLPHFPISFLLLSTPSQQPTEKWKQGSKEGKSGRPGVLQDWLWPIDQHAAAPCKASGWWNHGEGAWKERSDWEKTVQVTSWAVSGGLSSGLLQLGSSCLSPPHQIHTGSASEAHRKRE